MITYKQLNKNITRQAALTTAVKALTKFRSKACCVRNSYVREVYSYLTSKGTDYDEYFANHLEPNTIKLWESFHNSCVERKSAKDLKVCYLSGPEPENDFQVLVNSGVNPYNIWAFESDNRVYNQAISAIKKSRFPMLKLHKGSIEQFFINTPKKFDIIYIDGCGPLPSQSQNTLRLVSTIFRHHRLTPLGALITNFSRPDITDPIQLNNFSYLVTNYLYPKEFIEGYHYQEKTSLGAHEGPVAYSLDLIYSLKPKENSFFHYVKNNFEFYYGQYITRQLFDLATTIVPWIRIVNSPYWNGICDQNPKSIVPIMRKNQIENEYGGDLLAYTDMHPFQWTFFALNEQLKWHHRYLDLGKLENFSKSYFRELNGLPAPAIDARTVIDCKDAIVNDTGLLSKKYLRIIKDFKYMESMPLFCDVPTRFLTYPLLINQLSFPMHYSVDFTKRWEYKAKKTIMFTDLIVFDECRYIYEWMPTIDLLEDGYLNIDQQLCYRFALDGLNKNCRWLNPEYFGGAAIIDQDTKGFEVKELQPRKIV